jgi:hypothetical protein
MKLVSHATTGVLLTVAALLTTTPAQALTAQECSAKYQAAKADGSLNDQSWNDFRKQHCGAEAATSPSAGDSKTAETKPADARPEAKPDTKPDTGGAPAKAESKAKKKSAAAPAVSQGPAVYPTAIDAKFAKEKPTLARLHTCAQQWRANKAANTTGGLRWIQKGGGYWSECNKRLKG